MSVKAIIFDLGGVLFTNGTKNAIDFLKSNYSIDHDILEKVFYSEKSFALREGKISSRDYWAMIKRDVSAASKVDFKKIWYDSFLLNEKLLKIVKKLKDRYITGIFSDNINDRIEFLENKYDYSRYFDFKIYSFNTSFNKLNIESFDILQAQLNAFGIQLNEAIFIDDYEECLQIANQKGLQTFLYKNNDELINELVSMGVKLF